MSNPSNWLKLFGICLLATVVSNYINAGLSALISFGMIMSFVGVLVTLGITGIKKLNK